MRRLALLFLALAAPLAAQAPATTHPDFSGKWNLDAAASGAPAGVTALLTIAQDAKGIKVDQKSNSPMGEQSVSLAYTFEGQSKNTVNTPMGGVDMNSTIAWDGAMLVIKTITSVQGQTIDQTDKWSLSADGKTLTIDTSLNISGQSMQRKQILTKA
jgi:hypothetical protein